MSVLRGGASYASQGRISVAGHRAEPNEHGRAMCRGRYSACSGYNCRWWAAVALGGPVSINQPALNTRPRPLARAESHDSPADRNCPECGLRARSMSRGELPALAREASKYHFHRGADFLRCRPPIYFIRPEHRFSVTVTTTASPFHKTYFVKR